ncbi:MAG: tripartite tricarboxylate transporter substrate binding protein [Syntrophaceae bacterium]|nr:tripartite tricarboxylate transporter substrate binding protein [Syntrophaceae bacterium]
MKKVMIGLWIGGFLLFLGGFSQTARADDPYPTRAIQVIVPFPPGGEADLTARPLAMALEPILKQPVVVVNKAGAGGTVGIQSAAVSKPDGYTILVALASVAYLHEVDRLFNRPPAYKPDNFIPLAMLTCNPLVIAVHQDSPWKKVEDFVADAKKQPGKIKLGSAGIYSVMHVAAELFFKKAGIQLSHIPYTGGGPVLNALLGRHVDCAAFGPSVIMAQMKAGTVRPLVVLGDKRLESMPDVPTAKEKGIDAEFYIWCGALAVKGTPDSAVRVLREGIREAVKRSQFVNAMEKLMSPIQYKDQPEFVKFLEIDEKRSVEVVRAIGKVQ